VMDGRMLLRGGQIRLFISIQRRNPGAGPVTGHCI